MKVCFAHLIAVVLLVFVPQPSVAASPASPAMVGPCHCRPQLLVQPNANCACTLQVSNLIYGLGTCPFDVINHTCTFPLLQHCRVVFNVRENSPCTLDFGTQVLVARCNGQIIKALPCSQGGAGAAHFIALVCGECQTS